MDSGVVTGMRSGLRAMARPPCTTVAVVLTAAIAVAVAAHPLSMLLRGRSGIFHVGFDYSPMAYVVYLCWLAAITQLWIIGIAPRYRAARLWSVAFMVMLVDDAFMVHETVGERLRGWLDLGDGSVVTALAELVGFLPAAISVGVAAFVGLRVRAVGMRTLSWGLVLGLAALGVFAVGVDIVHTLFDDGMLGDALTLLEEVGEAAVQAAIVVGLLAAMIVGRSATPAWVLLDGDRAQRHHRPRQRR